MADTVLQNSWRYNHPPVKNFIGQAYKLNPNLRSFYQFGVYTCRSIKDMADIVKEFNIDLEHIWGFDSFAGLSDDKAEPFIFEEMQKIENDWFIGQYSAQDWFGVTSVKEAVLASYNALKPYISFNKLTLIAGYVEDSLTDFRAKSMEMNPALYVDFDLDIYSPTLCAMDFMFRNGLIVPGTICGFDDWGVIGHETGRAGEPRAHKEITEKYNVGWNLLYQIGDRPPHIQRLYQVISRD